MAAQIKIVTNEVSGMMKNRWHLINDPALPGKVNMARDLSILYDVATKKRPPTLRLYKWYPPAVSIGFFQDQTEVINTSACEELGIELVQRPTGGSAVLHYHELTYSINLPEQYASIPEDVLERHKLFSQVIVDALRELGVDSYLYSNHRRREASDDEPCFNQVSLHEIQVRGKKVVGSAQLCRSGVVLQHGAILMGFPLDLHKKIFKTYDNDLGKKLKHNAAGLLDLGYNLDCENLESHIVANFEKHFNVEFTFCTNT